MDQYSVQRSGILVDHVYPGTLHTT